MAGYDPFSGGSSNSGSYSNYNYGNKKKTDYTKYIKQALPILIIGVILFIIVKFVFFNSCIVDVSVKNTEGTDIFAISTISFTKEGSIDSQNFSLDEEIKLKKGNYNVKIRASGYNPQTENYDLDDSEFTIEPVTLEKNLKLKINSITFPEQIFSGQSITVKLEVENNSPNETYDSNYIIFEEDVEDWVYKYKDIHSNILDKVTFYPQKEKAVFIEFKVPSDIEEGEYNILPRIKFKNKDTKLKKEFTIVKKPIIKFNFTNLEGDYEITKTNNYTITYEINNSGNNLTINDLKFNLDIDSTLNPDCNTWFSIPQNYKSVEPKSKESGTIQVSIPNNAKPEILIGQFIITSSSLDQPHTEDIELNLIEPEINFNISLSKSTVNLEYDQNNNVMSIEDIKLELKNQSGLNINISNISILNSTLTSDCNKFIYPNQNYITTISKDSTSDIAIRVTLPKSIIDYMNTIDLTDPNNLSKSCIIRVQYKHPFKDDEFLESQQNLTIDIDKS